MAQPAGLRWVGLGLLGIVLSCSDADGDATDVTVGDSGGDAPLDQAGDGDGAGETLSCFSGAWTLTQLLCDGEDRTDDLLDQGGVDTMVLDVAALEDGTCEVFLTSTGPSCREVARHVYTFTDAGDITAVSSGITACDPAACQFNALDGPCVIEDRAGAVPRRITVAGDQVEIVHDPPDGICGGFGQSTTSRYQRVSP